MIRSSITSSPFKIVTNRLRGSFRSIVGKSYAVSIVTEAKVDSQSQGLLELRSFMKLVPRQRALKAADLGDGARDDTYLQRFRAYRSYIYIYVCIVLLYYNYNILYIVYYFILYHMMLYYIVLYAIIHIYLLYEAWALAAKQGHSISRKRGEKQMSGVLRTQVRSLRRLAMEASRLEKTV